MRRKLALAVAVLAAAAAVSAAAFARVGTGAPVSKQLENVSFISVCRFSHRAPDDPIVFFGQPQKSHDHSFFGNVTTDAFSTSKTLLPAATTCDRSDDTAAYWAPTLSEDDQPVLPIDASAYYRRSTIARVRAFPVGFQMVAGDSHATTPQSTSITWWDCGTHGGAAPSSTAPTCPDAKAQSLRLNVRFPDCWDGRQLDSPDHHSHMAYSARGICPASHPVAVPQITVVVHYPVAGGSNVQLASGGQFSGHADFMNAWQQAGLEQLVDYCLNALRTCGHAP